MGAVTGKPQSTVFPLEGLDSAENVVSEAQKTQYRNEGLIPLTSPCYLLRMLLDNKVSARVLKRYAHSEASSNIVERWYDLIEYRSSQMIKGQHDCGLHLYLKHVRTRDRPKKEKSETVESAGVTTAGFATGSSAVQDEMKCCGHFCSNECLNRNEMSCSAYPHAFDWLLRTTFIDIYNEVYAPLVASKNVNLNKLVSISRTSLVQGSVHDFMFEKLLGVGAFGMVVLCRQPNSGKQFAMKLQEKDEMLSFYNSSREQGSDPCCESKCLAKFSHPYIIKMHSAFQTSKLAVMVLECMPDGDLSTYLRSTTRHCLPEEQVVFYIAELISAVGYMVSMLTLRFVKYYCS